MESKRICIVLGVLLLGITTIFITSSTVDAENSVPIGFEKGDIMFLELIWWRLPQYQLYDYVDSNDHCVMYYGEVNGEHYFVDAADNELRTFSDYENLEFLDFSFWHVDVNDTIKTQAAELAYNCMHNRGDTFQLGVDHEKEAYDSNAQHQEWYCSELVWAAYYEYGIDIDENGWGNDFPPGNETSPSVYIGWVLPTPNHDLDGPYNYNDIQQSNYTYKLDNSLLVLFEGADSSITVNGPFVNETITENTVFIFPENSTIELTANCNLGTGLIYWYGSDYSSLNNITIDLDEDKTINAHFEQVNGPNMSSIPPDFLEPGDILLYQMDPGGDPDQTMQPWEYFFNQIEYNLFGYGHYLYWILPAYEHSNMYVGNITYFNGTENVTVEHGVIDTGRPTTIYEYGDYISDSPISHVDYYRVSSANASQKQAAVNWYLDKVGVPYQSFFMWFGAPEYPDVYTNHNGEVIGGARKSNVYDDDGMNPNASVHPDRAKFYCHESVWASYYNQGIDIDKDDWNTGWEYFPDLKIPDLERVNGSWKKVWNETHFIIGDNIVCDDDVIPLYHIDGNGSAIGPNMSKPSGPANISQYVMGNFTCTTADEDVYVQWDWGHFIGPWTYQKQNANSNLSRPHIWPDTGTYQVRVRAKNESNIIGPWSESITVNVTDPPVTVNSFNDSIQILVSSGNVTRPFSWNGSYAGIKGSFVLEHPDDVFEIWIHNLSGIPRVDVNGSMIVGLCDFQLWIDDIIDISWDEISMGFELETWKDSGCLWLDVSNYNKSFNMNGSINIDDWCDITLKGVYSLSRLDSTSGHISLCWNESGNLSITGWIDKMHTTNITIKDFMFSYADKILLTYDNLTIGHMNRVYFNYSGLYASTLNVSGSNWLYLKNLKYSSYKMLLSIDEFSITDYHYISVDNGIQFEDCYDILIDDLIIENTKYRQIGYLDSSFELSMSSFEEFWLNTSGNVFLSEINLPLFKMGDFIGHGELTFHVTNGTFDIEESSGFIMSDLVIDQDVNLDCEYVNLIDGEAVMHVEEDLILFNATADISMENVSINCSLVNFSVGDFDGTMDIGYSYNKIWISSSKVEFVGFTEIYIDHGLIIHTDNVYLEAYLFHVEGNIEVIIEDYFDCSASLFFEISDFYFNDIDIGEMSLSGSANLYSDDYLLINASGDFSLDSFSYNDFSLSHCSLSLGGSFYQGDYLEIYGSGSCSLSDFNCDFLEINTFTSSGSIDFYSELYGSDQGDFELDANGSIEVSDIIADSISVGSISLNSDFFLSNSSENGLALDVKGGISLDDLSSNRLSIGAVSVADFKVIYHDEIIVNSSAGASGLIESFSYSGNEVSLFFGSVEFDASFDFTNDSLCDESNLTLYLDDVSVSNLLFSDSSMVVSAESIDVTGEVFLEFENDTNDSSPIKFNASGFVDLDLDGFSFEISNENYVILMDDSIINLDTGTLFFKYFDKNLSMYTDSMNTYIEHMWIQASNIFPDPITAIIDDLYFNGSTIVNFSSVDKRLISIYPGTNGFTAGKIEIPFILTASGMNCNYGDLSLGLDEEDYIYISMNGNWSFDNIGFLDKNLGNLNVVGDFNTSIAFEKSPLYLYVNGLFNTNTNIFLSDLIEDDFISFTIPSGPMMFLWEELDTNNHILFAGFIAINVSGDLFDKLFEKCDRWSPPIEFSGSGELYYRDEIYCTENFEIQGSFKSTYESINPVFSLLGSAKYNSYIDFQTNNILTTIQYFIHPNDGSVSIIFPFNTVLGKETALKLVFTEDFDYLLNKDKFIEIEWSLVENVLDGELLTILPDGMSVAFWRPLCQDWKYFGEQDIPEEGMVNLLAREKDSSKVYYDDMEIIKDTTVNLTAYYTPANGLEQTDEFEVSFYFDDTETYETFNVPYSEETISISTEHTYQSIGEYTPRITISNDPNADNPAEDTITIEVTDNYLRIESITPKGISYEEIPDLVDENGKINGKIKVENRANPSYTYDDTNWMIDTSVLQYYNLWDWSFDPSSGYLSPGEIQTVNFSFTPPPLPGDFEETIRVKNVVDDEDCDTIKFPISYGLFTIRLFKDFLTIEDTNSIESFQDVFSIDVNRYEQFNWTITDCNSDWVCTPDQGTINQGDGMETVDIEITAPDSHCLVNDSIWIQNVNDIEDEEYIELVVKVGDGGNNMLYADPGPPDEIYNKPPSEVYIAESNTVEFDASESLAAGDQSEDTLEYTWNFGDNTQGTEKIVSHEYSEGGYYTVELTVQDADHNCDVGFTNAVIPGVSLSANPLNTLVDTEVSFTAKLIEVEPSVNYYYKFIYGDGYTETFSEGNSQDEPNGLVENTYSYDQGGTYDVSVEVYDGDPGSGGSLEYTGIETVNIDYFDIDHGGPYVGLLDEPIDFSAGISPVHPMMSVKWDLGDGTILYGSEITHTYTDYDIDENECITKNIVLTVNGMGLAEDTVETTVDIYNAATYEFPEANIDVNSYCGNPGETFNFDGSDSTNGSGNGPLTYEWQYSGESNWYSGEDRSVAFHPSDNSLPTRVMMKLRVTDDNGFYDIDTVNITISKAYADFIYPSYVTDTEQVQFTDRSAPDACNEITDYYWNFGDGSTSTDEDPTHQYQDDGYYTVKHRVYSNGQWSDWCSKRVYIRNQPPTISYNLTPVINLKNELINFSSNCSDEDGEIIDWKWTFGDHHRKYAEHTNHSYDESGLYTVYLTCTDDDYDRSWDDKQLLIADAFVHSDYDSNTPGWQSTRFDSIKDAVDVVPEDGILVLLNDSYALSSTISVSKSMSIYGINQGYNPGDTSIGYGDVTISGEQVFPLFSISNADVKIKGITFQSATNGIHITNGDLTVENCAFIECSTGINVTGAKLLDISQTTLTNNTIGIYLKDSHCDEGSSITGMTFEGNTQSITLSDCSQISIIECSMEPVHRGMLISSSNLIELDEISIHSPNLQGINIDNSKNISVSHTDIDHTNTAIYIGNVSIVNTSDHLTARVLNHIENCTFSFTDYGVRLNNADGTRIGGSSWYITHLENGFPCYYMDEIAENPMSWFTPREFPEGCLFYGLDYPIYATNSDYSVIDGVQILSAFASIGENVMSSETGISLTNCDHTVLHYNLLSKCNSSAVLLDNSDHATIAFNFIKKNHQGINITKSTDSLILANSFYKNKNTAVNFSTGFVSDNEVMYNDFMFNGDEETSMHIEMKSGNQAFDNGENNNWDDNKTSPWRTWLSQYTEITDKDQGLGNYWSDYNGTNDTGTQLAYNQMVKGPVPCNFDNFPADPDDYPTGLPLPPVGNTSYMIPGNAGSEDHYPVLRTWWPAAWYNYIEEQDRSPIPNNMGVGGTISITTNITDLFHNVTLVRVNITGPDGNWTNETMTCTDNNTYQYNFTETWNTGLYNYTIWAKNDNNYSDTGNTTEFWVNASASMQVCTLQNEYTNSNTSLDLTDPPGGVHNDIGYELLDDGAVLHVWNRFDSYYFNTSSGIQITNHFDQYWTRNILMLGYYNNDEWHVLYRTDELSGFNKMIDTDNSSYLNATLWKDLSYGDYDFRLAIRYHLGVDDHELTVIPYIKNLGVDIPYDLGFAWEINDIQIDMTPEHDYVLINDTSYYLNESLDLCFTNLSRPIMCWNESLNQSVICGYEPIPQFYIREDLPDDNGKSLYLKWNPDVNYKVWITSRNNTYNAPVVLGMKIGTLSSGQSKQTKIYWYDASEVTYYFDEYSAFETWANYPAYMVNGNAENAAFTSSIDDSELCTSTSCSSGTDLGTISKVEIRGAGVKSGSGGCGIVFRPKFSGKSGNDHTFTLSTTSAWSDWFDITEDTNAPRDWTWNDVRSLDCQVISDIDFSFPMPTAYCSKIELRITYTSYTPPSVSNPSPIHGATNVTISPTVGITVSDDDGDTLSVNWLSNCSGNWTSFGTNNSVGNGTYYQTLTGADVNGQWWYWMVNVSDGNNYNESSVFKFYTGTQSKISNTGDTNISGYLLMQVEYLNGSNWTVDSVVINDTSPRTINASSELGLDTVFNGLITVGELVNGDGEYHVYAMFCDAEGDVLVVDGEKLEAWWRFDVALS